MRRALVGLGVAVTVATSPSATAGPSQFTPPRACEGLPICVPIGGPWVVVPGPTARASTGTAAWQITCPPAIGIVGGLDVRAATKWVDVYFPGRIGSPVNPGVTTANDVVFTALNFGPRDTASSFLPFVGCIPSQGGQRSPTGVAAPRQFRSGAPIARRVQVLEVRAGRPARTVHSCKPGERLLSFQTTVGIFSARAPSPRQLRAVRVASKVRKGKISVTAVRPGLNATIAAQVQIHALCGAGLAG